MKKPIVNIGILLLLIIVLPPLFFTSYEIGNLYQNERMIDSIYTRQLESVIFSINQYSDDVVSGWANQLEQDIRRNDTTQKGICDQFINRNKSVEMVFFADTTNINSNSYRDLDKKRQEFFNNELQTILDLNQIPIKRLIQYMSSSYRKIQPIDLSIPDHSLFLFAYKWGEEQIGICGIVVNTQGFIRENLGPKIQSVAQDQFYFSVFEKETDKEVYTNEFYETEDKNIEHKKPLWLMPDYQLGIQLKGETIEDLVNKRTNFNIWIIILMDLILIVAVAFIFRALRQQMKLAQMKSEFISNVSHEIRTPIAVINMYSETLEMGRVKDEERKKEYYSIINTESNRLAAMVNKILNFSKIENGKRVYKFEETNLNNVVGDIIETYHHHFRRKEFTCNYSPTENLPPIDADSEAITDAIINLIDNAIKYSKDNKKIDILTGRVGNSVYVEVRDYGVGIDQKYQKMVFDKFYRVTDGNLAHMAKGSGIGLSIVDHIMNAHNGTISLISKIGEGSRFILNFPAKKQKP